MSVTSNVDQIKSAFHSEFGACVDQLSTDMFEAITNQIESENYTPHQHVHKGLKDGTIIDTGALHDSIQPALDVADPVYYAYAGSNLDYAWETHEVGSYGGHIEPRPFVEDALRDKGPEYQQTITDAFGRALAGFV